MRSIILTNLLVLVLAATAVAEVPQTVSFQGRLTDSDGVAVPDGEHTVTITIYAHPTEGFPVWNRSRQVNVSGGVFSVILGEILALDLPFDQDYYVSVTYENEPPMTPRIPLTASPYALGVHGSAAVTSLNGVTGDANLVAGSNVTIDSSGSDLVISATGDVADNDWTVVGEDMHASPTGDVGIGTSDPESKFQVVGNITAGGITGEGSVYAYNNGDEYAVLGGDYQGEGSQLLLVSETGDYHTVLRPDLDGEGGYFKVSSGLGDSAFEVNGYANVDGQPRVSMHGNSSVVFDLGESGDGSVLLPVDAINASEIFNEPGVASRTQHGGTGYVLTDSHTPITSRSISAPSDGYIMATASVEVELNHQGTASYVTTGLSQTTNSLPNTQDHTVLLPDGAGQGQYLFPCSATTVVPVAAGYHTIYLLGSKGGAGDAKARDAQLSLLFVPTSYGLVTMADGNDGGKQGDSDRRSPAVTSSDLAEEQRQSARANQDRVDRELADLRAKLDAVTSQVTNLNGNAQAPGRR